MNGLNPRGLRYWKFVMTYGELVADQPYTQDSLILETICRNEASMLMMNGDKGI